MCETSITPLRVAMPNRVMKPMIEATDRTPPEAYSPATPPMRASGRFSTTCATSRPDPKASQRSAKMPAMTAAPRNAHQIPKGLKLDEVVNLKPDGVQIDPRPGRERDGEASVVEQYGV